MLSTAPTTYEASLKAGYRAAHKRLNAGRVPIPIQENPAPSDVINSKSQGFADVSGTDRGGAPIKDVVSAQDYIPPYTKRTPAFGATTGKAKVITIINAASRYSGEPTSAILSQRHHPRLVRPRHIAMYLCQQLTTLSYPTIGRFLGDRDHSTIMYGVGKIKSLLQSDQQLAADVAAIRALAVAADPGLGV